MRRAILTILLPAIVLMVGCGPMATGPMPPRLEADAQKQYDDGWEKALTPVDHLDRQAMLDAVVVTHAFQVGVDRLSFRSEKKFSGGLVVMEIQFDRAKPADDRFELRIVGPNDQVLRQLTYTRNEVEETFHELVLTGEGTCKKGPNGQPLTPDEMKSRGEMRQKRIDAVQKLFPTQDDDKK